jgi:O-antigen/teichoic acid export membrane protein
MLQLLKSQVPDMISIGAKFGESTIAVLVRRHLGQYVTIFSGLFGRLLLQAAYFILLANSLSLHDFGFFAGISAAGIMIGSFSAFGFTASVYRTATTRLLLLRNYIAAFYIAFGVSVPTMMLVAYLLYLVAFRDLVELSSFLEIAFCDIVLWRLLEAISQINAGLGEFGKAAAIPIIGSAARLAAVVAFILFGCSGLDQWAEVYLMGNCIGTALSMVLFLPRVLPRWRGVAVLLRGRMRESLLFSVSFFVFFAQSELDKLLATLTLGGRVAGIYAISMRIIDLTTVPIRSFLTILVREIMQGRGPDWRWRTSLLIEFSIGFVSLLSFLALIVMLWFYPMLLGAQVAQAAQLFAYLLLIPPLKNLQEYHAELFFARNRMEVRAVTVILLVALKCILVLTIFVSVSDLERLGLFLNVPFVVTYLVSATVVYLTFCSGSRSPWAQST